MKLKLLNLIIVFPLLVVNSVFGQTEEVIYHETFGQPVGNIKVNDYTGYDHFEISYFCVNNQTDVRATSASATSQYAMASGGGNVMINNVNKTFYIVGIDISEYTNLSLAFGLRKDRIASNGSELLFRMVIDEDTSGYFQFDLPTGSGTAIFHWVEIPATYLNDGDAMSLIFEGSGNEVGFRIDDIYLTGIKDENLPIDLIDFSVQSKRGDLYVQWQTAMEKEVSHYEVEQSVNGKDFYFLSLETAKNEDFGATYSKLITASRNQPLPQFYRLKSVDEDGSYKYSKVVVLLENQVEELFHFPTYIAMNEALVLDEQWEGASLMLYDLNGSLKMYVPYVSTLTSLTFNPLSHQMYILKVSLPSGKYWSQKVIIHP